MSKKIIKLLSQAGMLASLAYGAESLARPAYNTRYDMTHQQYQEETTALKNQGYRVKYVDGYTRSGRARFAAIWEKSEGPAWIARHGLTSQQLNEQVNERIRGGEYQAVLIDGYEDNGQVRYAALWEKRTVPEQAIRGGLSSAQYQAEFNRLKNLGYSLSYVSGYNVKGKVYYAAIWDKQNPGDRQKFARHGLSWQGVINEIRRLGPTMSLRHISAYTDNGSPRYAAIWEQRKSGDPRQEYYLGVTNNQYNHKFYSMLVEGYLPAVITGNDSKGSPRISIIFRTEKNPQTTGKSCTTQYCFSLDSLKQTIIQNVTPLSGKSLYKYAFEFSLGNAKVSSAAGPYRGRGSRDFTVHDRINPASVTKTITAVGLLKAINRTPGVTINSRIGPYLPSNWAPLDYVKNLTFADVLSHKTGLSRVNDNQFTGCGNGFDVTYQLLKERVTKAAGPAGCETGTRYYSNTNYGLAYILLTSLNGYNNWAQRNDAQNSKYTAENFINFMNTNVYKRIGIPKISYTPASDSPLFYPWPNTGWRSGKQTNFGDWSKRPGSAGAQISTHEMNIFARALFDGPLLPVNLRRSMQDNKMGLWDEWSPRSGVKCYWHGGYFPQQADQSSNGYDAQLGSVLVGCSNGLRGFMVINGLNSQNGNMTFIDRTVRAAINSSFTNP